MPDLQVGSLVLFKGRPARVVQTGPRLVIQTSEGGTHKVRPKDVRLLHPGPVEALPEASPPEEALLLEAWEVVQGETIPLAELAELIYGVFSPQTAWATWQAVADGLYFTGTPEAVQARSADAVKAERRTREARAAQSRAWEDFLHRARRDAVDPDQDWPFVQDVVALARGQSDRSRVLRALGSRETPENAHRLLLRWGVWGPRENPYPYRLRLSLKPPEVPLPPLPDEPRRDLTHLPALAIDDEGSRDPDDALSLEGNRLWVHVADVAALVAPGSPADEEARARGASVYLPEAIVPMLPEAARERLALGLQPVSPALSIGIDLSPNGDILDVEVTSSWVRVTRLTYAEAEDMLGSEVLLQALEALLAPFAERRRQAGAVELSLPEVKVIVDEEGDIQLRPILPLRSRQLVREAMLAAGEAVARYGLAQGIPLPFTTQEPPVPLAEIPPGLAGMFALRKTLRRSEYHATPGPHHGLGLPLYVQATSPLRRYLDLVVHQQLRAHWRGEDLLDAQEVLERVGAAEAVVGAVRQVERLSRRHWLLVYLLEHPHWQGTGVLVEHRPPWGTFLVPELGLSAQVHLGNRELPLNTTVRLAVEEVLLPEREVHFSLLLE